MAVTGIPGHDELAPMAAGMIQAALSGDSPTMGTIAREIKHMGMTSGRGSHHLRCDSWAHAGRNLWRSAICRLRDPFRGRA